MRTDEQHVEIDFQSVVFSFCFSLYFWQHMQCNYLFIYGTLLRDLRGKMFDHFEKELKYISKGFYQGKMYHIVYYPGVVPSTEKNDAVKGEVYQILNEHYLEDVLDDYEGAGKNFKGREEYVRQIENVNLENGKKLNCWIYLFNRPVNEFTLVKDGDYVRFVKDNNINSWVGI